MDAQPYNNFLSSLNISMNIKPMIYLDEVHHNELLLKLWCMNWYNYCGDDSNNIRISLNNVHCNGSYSTILTVLSGVSQKSILGPLLFLVYITE